MIMDAGSSDIGPDTPSDITPDIASAFDRTLSLLSAAWRDEFQGDELCFRLFVALNAAIGEGSFACMMLGAATGALALTRASSTASLRRREEILAAAQELRLISGDLDGSAPTVDGKAVGEHRRPCVIASAGLEIFAEEAESLGEPLDFRLDLFRVLATIIGKRALTSMILGSAAGAARHARSGRTGPGSDLRVAQLREACARELSRVAGELEAIA